MKLGPWPKWLGGWRAKLSPEPPKTPTPPPPASKAPSSTEQVTPTGKPNGRFRRDEITDSLFGG
jgi:hypothetical protein